MFLGVGIVFVQRRCGLCRFFTRDEITQIPERFSRIVFKYATKPGERMSEYFPAVWDRIVAYMHYEDKFESDAVGELSFAKGDTKSVSWDQLAAPAQPLQPTRGRQRLPDIFEDITAFEVCFRNYCRGWKGNLRNQDLQWRLFAIARGLGLPIPRPYRAPYIPGITVMIPHYGETIIMSKGELYDKGGSGEALRAEVKFGKCHVPVRETVPLIDWLKAKYNDEFRAFSHRMEARGDWPAGGHWDDFTDDDWDKICVWASMRMQTLWRTVAGMCLYHPALQCHFEVQKEPNSCLAKADIWKPRDCFTCLVSMQIYKTFDPNRLKQTNRMFDKFPDSLKVAYIDWDDVEEAARERATADGVHRKQQRRYFSCLIDKDCEVLGNLRRTPRYRIELPGFPILGDGKSDNQNHAIPFMRGVFCQCIDANQGAYFEQMLLLPCVLGEFRTRAKGVGKARRIIGLPEHITSDIGSIGDFAAGSEIAFGTISQRSFAVLGGRMHYGHPDIMNKQFMMQQGGVSKATKTINLSEDIFAGMDFTLRGGGRKIRHCEYFHLAKGRDLGFNAVLGFFSKLSNGTGEQLLTRQMLRLSHVLQLPESLTFYYAHAGYYITQYLLSMSMPLMVFTWLFVVASDCNREFSAFSDSSCEFPAAAAMASMLSTWYSVYILFFLIVTSLPLFAEIWMERNFGTACGRWLLQNITCSFLLFIFQAKIIGFYIMAEIRQGGASYVATGRGLPTERREFVGAPSFALFKLSLFVQNLDTTRLAASAALRHGFETAVRQAVAAAAASDDQIKPENVEVEITGGSNEVVVKVKPPTNVLTIPVKAKLTAESLGAAVAARINGVEDIRGVSVRTLLQKSVSSWRIERVGGLYLDYTQHTYYDAIELLFYTICVLYAGGYSEAGDKKNQLAFTFLSLGLVIWSWLHAPFMFNPYQFSVGYFMDDVKAWYGFFFTEGGQRWVEWYERVQLKPKRGLAKSIADFGFLFYFFAVTAWISLLSVKQQINVTIFSQQPIVQYTVVFTLIPPFVMSSLYCLALPIVEGCVGCGRRLAPRAARKRPRVTRALATAYARARGGDVASEGGSDDGSGSESGSSDSEAEVRTGSDLRHAAEDLAPQQAQQPLETCEKGVPLAVSAAIVMALQVFELLVPLMLCIKAPDRKLFVAGIVVKFLFLKIVLDLAEASLSMKGLCKRVDTCASCVHHSVELLVHANQMMRDIFVSAFIFLTLIPLVFLSMMNDWCCPRFSFHQALIYRQFGPLAKKQVRDDDYSSSDWDSSGADDGGTASSSSEAAPGVGSAPPPTYTVGPPPGGSATMLVPPRTAARSVVRVAQ